MTAGFLPEPEEQLGRTIYDLATYAADYPPWQGSPVRTVLVCSHMRSGSTLLGEALFFAGGFGCPIEYFHRGFRPTLEQGWGVDSQAGFLRELYRRRTDSTGTLGVKLFWPDVLDLCMRRFPEAGDLLKADMDEDETAAAETYKLAADLFAEIFPEPSFILLNRRDRLRQAVSASISAQTKVWRRIPGVHDNVPVCEPEYDFETIGGLYASAVYCTARWKGLFEKLGVSPYCLDYEDLVNSYEDTIRRLVIKLGGSDCADVKPARLKRQASQVSEAFAMRFLREYEERSASSD